MYFWYSRFKNWYSFIPLYFLMLHLFEWFISWIMQFLNKFSYIFWCLWFQLEWNYWNYNSIGYVCQSLFYWFHVFQLLFDWFYVCQSLFDWLHVCQLQFDRSHVCQSATSVFLSACVHPLELFRGSDVKL